MLSRAPALGIDLAGQLDSTFLIPFYIMYSLHHVLGNPVTVCCISRRTGPIVLLQNIKIRRALRIAVYILKDVVLRQCNQHVLFLGFVRTLYCCGRTAQELQSSVRIHMLLLAPICTTHSILLHTRYLYFRRIFIYQTDK